MGSFRTCALENGVHLGRDGWLFLASGSNDIERLFFEAGYFSEEEAAAWRDLLLQRKGIIEAVNARYLHVWVPDKITVYPEFLALEMDSQARGPLAVLGQPKHHAGLDDVVVCIAESLRADRLNQQLYWKTDTHWTYAGACVAHREICRALGVQPDPTLSSRPLDGIELALDLGAKLKPIRKERWSAPRILLNAKVVHKNEMVKFLDILAPPFRGDMHTGASVRYENSAGRCDLRRVLVFGDSYCEYRPHSLSALLAETFREILFVWSSSIDYDLVKTFRPDIVITEMAERFVKRIPKDDLRLNHFVQERIAQFLNTRCFDGSSKVTWVTGAA